MSGTASVKNACAQYGLTEEQLAAGRIRCQWRSMYGNSYAVVDLADVRALKKRLVEEENEKKKQVRDRQITMNPLQMLSRFLSQALISASSGRRDTKSSQRQS